MRSRFGPISGNKRLRKKKTPAMPRKRPNPHTYGTWFAVLLAMVCSMAVVEDGTADAEDEVIWGAAEESEEVI